MSGGLYPLLPPSSSGICPRSLPYDTACPYQNKSHDYVWMNDRNISDILCSRDISIGIASKGWRVDNAFYRPAQEKRQVLDIT
jgi:hypothetical protein